MAKKISLKARPIKRNGLTLNALHVAPFAAVRNPTTAITRRGQLITKTRKPA